MNRKVIAQIVVCLVVLFALGSICGYAVSDRVVRVRQARAQPLEWADRWMERRIAEDFARLSVTPEQEAALRPVYERLLSDFKVIQQESAQKVTDAFKRHRVDTWKQLTPAQREIFRQANLDRASRRAPNSNSPDEQ